MSLLPGMYTIHDTDTGRNLDMDGSPVGRVGTWVQNHTDGQKWYVKGYTRGSEYAIQNVATKKYIPTCMNGFDMPSVDESDAAAFHLECLEHGFEDIYLIKSMRTGFYLCHPNLKLRQNEGYTPVSFTERPTFKGCIWRFERIGDYAGAPLIPKADQLALTPPILSTNDPSPRSSGRLYPDDAHLYTDMLFNMPRLPFTRDQRIAALDWARKLGATNVPTIESFDECERRLEAALGNN
ncbi:hypothetical protein RSOLAG22IIIB_03655 [Rhizoctonia solani]|uniref:Ricin B lectin domain-containing protein n=1 Tax=Rhizoctonia solani TaxID=456999 RepID=A0A0K6FR99_9AGAM|nr:hypothetical protein RSOLAG22IIIB_03655 [Rhizoctonia solani]